MRLVGILAQIVVVLSLMDPVPAAAMWSLGANLGVTVHIPAEETGDDAVTLVGVPTQSSVFSSLRPGLRIGFTGEAMGHEGFIDASYDGQFDNGESIHAVRLGANYQHNFSMGSARPYVTAGAGILNLGADLGGASVGATSFTFGGGVGVGFPVSSHGGRLRVEARVDKLQEGKDDGVTLIDEAAVLQATFGFDLWMR